MNWRELCGAHPQQIFLKRGDDELSYENFWRAVDREREASRELYVAQAEHSFSTYVKLWANLETGGVCYLRPPWDHHDLKALDLTSLRQRLEAPPDGLFLIRTSGSTGTPKFVVHRGMNFLYKYAGRQQCFKRTVAFSSLHTIAGWETLFQVVAAGATLVLPESAVTPAHLGDLLRRERIELFQTTPSFLQFMQLAGELDRSFSDLTTITYGSEPPYEQSLRVIKSMHPGLQLLQTYGMSEIGIQLGRLTARDPLAVDFDESTNPVRINHQGTLEVRSLTTMLGHLDGTRPALTADGFFVTNDAAEKSTHGYRILGRNDELINVAGQKFFPAEVENAILRHPLVADVTVMRVTSVLSGNAVAAKLWPKHVEDVPALQEVMPQFLLHSLPAHMRPVRWEILTEAAPERAHKKIRRTPSS